MEVLIAAAYFAPVVLVVKVFHLLLTQQLTLSRRPAGRWIEAAVLCACAGLTVFAFSPFIGFARSTREVCASSTGRGTDSFTGLDGTIFPRSFACRWDDGSSTELVPMWVNPLIFACIAGVVARAALAVDAVVRRKGADDHE
ncbi:hypothetical protein FHX42_005018 [Saccharopolyspora lacisalsi]|uniref:Uncharacterized protein n=1 Tax=Halosaccharopolyspora lacisalsi TaxID=1000566 RepID=A0A839E097_9PSEU|nr:hypothetical protein [Halosaccharopolyspora lacisalsi]MBA8827622.1 hypothetical protein [Halosaccharopolyspora lacisalsi]